MKKIALTLIVLISTSALASGINGAWLCKMNNSKTQDRLKQELGQHPEAKGMTGDDGAIVKTDVKAFKIILKDSKIIDGLAQFTNSFIFSSKVWNFAETANMENSSASFSLRDAQLISKNRIVTGFDIDGWDHFNYKVILNPAKSSATIEENFDYDCGGGGSMAYGVYDCKILP